jgi:predicted AAA+ superfamily ATPase
MDRQKAEVVRNTEQFMRGRPANNALLWGARGTGKSTLIKAVFNAFVDRGLRLIEVEKEHLVDLIEIVEVLEGRQERFLLYCDDLSFEADDPGYKSLKAVLEGSIAAPPGNLLIYASSNRRHLLPEAKADNQDAHIVDGELHPGEAIEEKVSLSERFGLWLSFYPFNQDQYLAIIEHWLQTLGAGSCGDETTRQAALNWARQRGSRSGRVARQFAIDQAGRRA